MRLYIYQWTANPTTDLATDDLLRFFPNALIYAALANAYEITVKDLAGATYWRALLGGTPFGRGGELAKMKRENFKREIQDKLDFTPRLGPGKLQMRRLENLQLYR